MINVTVEMASGYYCDTYDNVSLTSKCSTLGQVICGNAPVFLGSVSQSISPLEIQSVGVGSTMPAYAAWGTYMAKVMIWNIWEERGAIFADNSGLVMTFKVT